LRRFIEIGLRSHEAEPVVSAAKSLGYSAVGLDRSAEFKNIDVVKRVDLDPKNPSQLSQALRRYRWKTEVITVNCITKAVARQVGRDRRVDLITFPFTMNWKKNYLDRQQAGLMRDSGCGYLINVSELLVSDANVLEKRIEFIKRNKDNAVKKGIPVVASSFASEPLELRDPYGLASLLSLIDVDEEHAYDMVSTMPYMIVARNREKLKDSYIQDGVWVIEDP